MRFDAERKQKCAIHAKKRAVSERVLALSASRFGGERVRKRADHAKKWVFCAAMCTGKDTEGKLQKACKSSVCGALSCRAHAKISVGRRVGAALGAVCGALWCRAGANGAKHAKKRAVSERVLALSASRFGGERVRKWADHTKKWVFCAAMCTGKDT